MDYEKKLIELTSAIPLSELKKASIQLSEQYLSRKWKLSSLQKLAYLICRLPATMAVLQSLTLAYTSILDLGAGPGMGALALQGAVTSVEQDPDFIELGKKLGAPTEWICGDFRNLPLKAHELVLFSYSLGEVFPLDLSRYWELAKSALVIIEPGTPKGYQTILEAREQLIHLGGHVIAPCPHHNRCPLQKPDWCHFGVKLPRSKLHRYVKEGTLGYEEEKFSYLLVSRQPVQQEASRILCEPTRHKGHMILKLCTPHEGLVYKTISRRDGELYKIAKKKRSGDTL